MTLEYPYGRRLETGGREGHLGSVGDGTMLRTSGSSSPAKRGPRLPPPTSSDAAAGGGERSQAAASFGARIGCPLLAVDSPLEAPIEKFFVLDNRFYFLEPAERQGESYKLGTLGSRRAAGRERAA
jgi:hypothetical protein